MRIHASPSVLALFLGLFLAGCGQRLAFEPTADSQEVTFITYPTTGGGGDPVVASLDKKQRPLRYNDLPVIVMSDAEQAIRPVLGPQPKENRDARVIVTARVHLEPAMATKSTNPPSKRRVYKVVVEKLHKAEWYTP